jgi:hypothetical protein
MVYSLPVGKDHSSYSLNSASCPPSIDSRRIWIYQNPETKGVALAEGTDFKQYSSS